VLLDELLARLTELPEKSRAEAIHLAVKSTATMAWVPNPGPQTQAFLCEAREVFYGGKARGGKGGAVGGQSRVTGVNEGPRLDTQDSRVCYQELPPLIPVSAFRADEIEQEHVEAKRPGVN
jgi:hypothetical protein